MFSFIPRYSISVVLVIVVVYLSLFTPPHIDFVDNLFGFDKIVHIAMYFAFTTIIWWESLNRPISFVGIKSRNISHKWLLLLIPVLFGAMMEYAQTALTYDREGSIYDAIANTIGALAAHLLFLSLTRRSR